MQYANRVVLDSNIVNYLKSFQQPFPAPTPIRKTYHRQLIEIAAVGVVLGVVFLMFWQSVLRGPPSVEFLEDYCTVTLSRYVAPDIAANADFNISQDGHLAECSVSGDAMTSMALGWSGSYDCEGTAVRYKAEENPNWLAVAEESEVPELVYSGDLLIANLSGTARFSYSTMVYNPTARAAFESQTAKLRSHSCE